MINPIKYVYCQIFDELGYLDLPPCLWGSPNDGLISPEYLSYDTNLLSIKKNNNTYAHFGEMASWQMRGILANKKPKVIIFSLILN